MCENADWCSQTQCRSRGLRKLTAPPIKGGCVCIVASLGHTRKPFRDISFGVPLQFNLGAFDLDLANKVGSNVSCRPCSRPIHGCETADLPEVRTSAATKRLRRATEKPSGVCRSRQSLIRGRREEHEAKSRAFGPYPTDAAGPRQKILFISSNQCVKR
jgi:hypothetical protein